MEQITQEQAKGMTFEEIKANAAAITPQYRAFNNRRNPDALLKSIYTIAVLEVNIVADEASTLDNSQQIERDRDEQQSVAREAGIL